MERVAALLPHGLDALAPDVALRLCRIWMDRVVRRYLPLTFESAGLYDDAAKLARIPPITLTTIGRARHTLSVMHHSWRDDRYVDGGAAMLEFYRLRPLRLSAYRVLSATITDLDIVRRMEPTRPPTTSAMFEEMLAIGSLGLEVVTLASTLVSPAIVAHELSKRAHDVAHASFLGPEPEHAAR